MLIFYNETKFTPSLTVQPVEGIEHHALSLELKKDDEFIDRMELAFTSDPDVIDVLKTKTENGGKGVVFRYTTGRFYCKPPVGKFGYNNKCELITFDPTDEASRTISRNVVVIIKEKNSKVVLHPPIIGLNTNGEADAIYHYTSETEDFEVLMYLVRFNNWAKLKYPTYFYIDGVNGKKQLKLSFTKTGPNKEYTSNVLYEEDFEGDEFPIYKEKPKKTTENSHTNNRKPGGNGKKPYHNKGNKYNKRNR